MIRANTKILILFLVLALSACDPIGKPGDLTTGANVTGTISNGTIAGVYTALYGDEVGQREPGQSAAGGNKNQLLIALFILTPEGEAWRLSGSGSKAPPWYRRLGYRQRWMHYPHSEFHIAEKDGETFENWERKEFNWEFDGRNRTIEIEGTSYPFTAGGLAVVKFDRDWNAEVVIGEASLNTMQIESKLRKTILECFKPLRLGTGALPKVCRGTG